MANKAGTIGEFELIARYFSDIGNAAAVDLAVGDDCALLTPPTGQQLAVSVDTLVANVHFPAQGEAYYIAQKTLRSNLSDLAAMGAEPLAFTLALSLPEANASWLAEFSRGLRDCANEFNIALIGGDTTRNPVATITIQVIGTLPIGAALLRSGAKAGDAIFISGTLGDACAALDHLTLPIAQSNSDPQFFLARYFKPAPRVALGIALRGIASAAIDVSDGLAADLSHILERSHVGAIIELEKLPLSESTRKRTDAIDCALNGGDDYELCFTVPPQHTSLIEKIASSLSLPLTEIGIIVADNQLIARYPNGAEKLLEPRGYKHF